MNKVDFVEGIKGMLSNRMGEEYEIKSHKTDIVNAPNEISLSIAPKGQSVAISIRMGDYYDSYQRKAYSMEGIVEEIRTIYNENKDNKPDTSKLTQVINYETIKQCLYIRLVNKEKNEEILNSIPYMEYLDLAVVFSILLEQNGSSIGSTTVTNSMMETWNVSKEVIYQDALNNGSRLFPVKIATMKDILSELTEGAFLSEELEEEHNMFVLSNRMGINGASVLLYPKILEEFRKNWSRDFYVLPSSIHETILVPFNPELKVEDLRKMVCDVNETLVKEEVLSNHVYFFGANQRLELIA